MSSTSKRLFGWGLGLAIAAQSGAAFGAVKEREPVTLSVVAVNPSEEKTQTTPVRIDLPQEVSPQDVLDRGKLTLEYDDERSIYYVYKDEVTLEPKETKVFEVVLRDLWFVREGQLGSLTSHTEMVLSRLAETEYAELANEIGASIIERLETIATVQDDDTLSRKSRIGAYRRHLLTIAQIKEDLARMEKLLAFTGGLPIPDMLEESPLKADAPSQTTTWLVIFLIIVFVGLLGGQFFFTWHRRAQVTQDLDVVRQGAFPSVSATAEGGNGTSAHATPPRPGARPS